MYYRLTNSLVSNTEQQTSKHTQTKKQTNSHRDRQTAGAYGGWRGCEQTDPCTSVGGPLLPRSVYDQPCIQTVTTY